MLSLKGHYQYVDYGVGLFPVVKKSVTPGSVSAAISLSPAENCYDDDCQEPNENNWCCQQQEALTWIWLACDEPEDDDILQ